MSETTTQTPLETLNVERNQASVKLVSVEKKRGKTPGELCYAFEPVTKYTQEVLDNFVKFFGLEQTINGIIARGNIQLQKYFDEARLQEDGKTPKDFDKDEFVGYVQKWSARGLTLGDINDEIARITTEITTLATDVDFLSRGKEAMLEVMQPKVDRIKELRAAIAERKNKSEDTAAA